MAGTKFSKRNINRYRKIYPYVRRKPVDKYISDKPITIESYFVTFTNATSATHTFQQQFDQIPYVTAVSVDNMGNSSADVNVFISSVTKAQVTFELSAPTTCRVHFHAIYIGGS